jgi:small-conductance mechanosensitive channel
VQEGIQIIEFIRPGGFFPAILALVIAWTGAWALSRFLEGLANRFTEKRLLIQQFSTVVGLLIYICGIVIAVVFVFKLTREMWLAVGGTAAVATGIALKDLAASVIAGLTIILDRPFQVGDRVSFGGYYGEITRIGLRSVRLITLDDNMVTIPNNMFLTAAVASGNAGALDMLIQLDYYIGCDQDIDDAREIVRDAMTSSRYTYLGKPWSLTVNQVIHENHFAVRLRAKAYVLDVHYEKAFETDVTERVMRGFRNHGIAAPAILHRGLDSPAPESRAS